MTLNHDQANQVAWNYKCDKAVTKLRVSYEDRKKAIHRHSRKGFLMIKAKTGIRKEEPPELEEARKHSC
jgi:hypothetical protein